MIQHIDEIITVQIPVIQIHRKNVVHCSKLNNGTRCISKHHVILHFISKVVIIHDLYLKHRCLNYIKQTTS
jgi:hypothetical protein